MSWALTKHSTGWAEQTGGLESEYGGNLVELGRWFKPLTHAVISSKQLFVVFNANHMLVLCVAFMCLTLFWLHQGWCLGLRMVFTTESEEREEQESKRWRRHGLWGSNELSLLVFQYFFTFLGISNILQ